MEWYHVVLTVIAVYVLFKHIVPFLVGITMFKAAPQWSSARFIKNRLVELGYGEVALNLPMEFYEEMADTALGVGEMKYVCGLGEKYQPKSGVQYESLEGHVNLIAFTLMKDPMFYQEDDPSYVLRALRKYGVAL